MKGFFTQAQTQSVSRPGGKLASCVSCGLLRQAQTPQIQPWGEYKQGILLVLPYPSENEDDSGNVLSGKGGRLLKRVFSENGIDIQNDCLVTYALRCRPDEIDSITGVHINCCRRLLLETIKQYNPSTIIPFGPIAVESLIGNRFTLGELGGIHKWRGWQIPDQELKAWVCPVFAPSFVLQAKGAEVMTIWSQDIKKAIQAHFTKFPRYKKPEIEFLESDLSRLYDIPLDTVCAFDYEATGIKPHADGHRIVCVSIADTDNHVFAFMLPPTKRQRRPFLDFLANSRIPKVAQNMKYEENWSRVRLGVPVAGWLWDTMLATHCIDNRSGVTGLKFQTYTQFGVIDYSSHITPYLQAENSNAINKVLELVADPAGKLDLLTYCAYDSIFERRLYTLQTKELDYDFLPF